LPIEAQKIRNPQSAIRNPEGGGMASIELKRRIRWADADAAGRLHFPRIFEYFEEGEGELLRSVGFTMFERGGYDFPRKHVEATFHRALPLDAPFVMRVTVGKLGNTSIRYDYHIFADDDCAQLALEGSMTVVVVKDGKPAPIPDKMRKALS
jgi:YbgC/YbaW family acyl-CoA thioester hydrolase